MAKKLKSIDVPRTLLSRGLLIFSRRDFQRLFNVSGSAVTFFLFRHCRSGLFIRLKNGLYALASRFPAEEEIANRLYQPSYLSFEYVLARHGIIPEAVYSITSATTKPTRRFEVEGKTYEYFTIKREAYTGYQPEKIKGRVVLIASPEKALVDTLYFVCLKKRQPNDRMDISKLSKKRVLAHAKLFRYPPLVKMVRGIL